MAAQYDEGTTSHLGNGSAASICAVGYQVYLVGTPSGRCTMMVLL